MPFVSRAGQKLEHSLNSFGVDAANKICADFGSNTGGFVDCLLGRGATKVYAIDTGYGVLEWKLRKDARVVVMERTNAIHVELPEKVQIVTIDVAWTKQKIILPAAMRVLAEGGCVISLIKPHYEAPPKLLKRGILPAEHLESVIESAKKDIVEAGFEILGVVQSPIKGAKGNVEHLVHLVRSNRSG